MLRILVAGAAGVAMFGALSFVSVATTTTEAQSTPASVKGDRLDAKPYGTSCSQQSWPYYEPQCLRNTTAATRDAKPVRIVTVNRNSR